MDPTKPMPSVSLDVSHPDPKALNDLVAELRRAGYIVTITRRSSSPRQPSPQGAK